MTEIAGRSDIYAIYSVYMHLNYMLCICVCMCDSYYCSSSKSTKKYQDITRTVPHRSLDSDPPRGYKRGTEKGTLDHSAVQAEDSTTSSHPRKTTRWVGGFRMDVRTPPRNGYIWQSLNAYRDRRLTVMWIGCSCYRYELCERGVVRVAGAARRRLSLSRAYWL